MVIEAPNPVVRHIAETIAAVERKNVIADCYISKTRAPRDQPKRAIPDVVHSGSISADLIVAEAAAQHIATAYARTAVARYQIVRDLVSACGSG